MTAQSAIPLKWYVPFAQSDSSRVELPVTTADPTRASQTLGFPPLTMQPPESGGVPPQGEDFNGGMNQVARIAWWVLNGGGWPYDSTFATNSNINGYPNGAKLQGADFLGDWINTADNNQNNPDTNGTNWVPGFQYGVTALTGLTGGTVTPTPAQAAKGSITLAGTLGSALTIILPNWVKNWTITNSTTGAFVTIVKTAAGSGITIPQTAQPTRVSGDGTNITQAAENVAAATTAANPVQLSQLPLLASGVYGVRGFRGANNATTPATQFDMYCDSVCLRNPTTGAIVGAASGATITNNIATAGPVANGRDVAGAFAAGWVHFYYIWNGAVLATLSSNSAPPSAPTLPTGYTQYAYAGAVYYGGATLSLVRQRGAWAMYADLQSAVSGGTATSVTPVSIPTLSPPNAIEFELVITNLSVLAAANSAGSIQLNLQVEASHTPFQMGIQGVGLSATSAIVATSGASKRFSALSQGFNYQITTITGSTQSTSISVSGYSVPNGGE